MDSNLSFFSFSYPSCGGLGWNWQLNLGAYSERELVHSRIRFTLSPLRGHFDTLYRCTHRERAVYQAKLPQREFGWIWRLNCSVYNLYKLLRSTSNTISCELFPSCGQCSTPYRGTRERKRAVFQATSPTMWTWLVLASKLWGPQWSASS